MLEKRKKKKPTADVNNFEDINVKYIYLFIYNVTWNSNSPDNKYYYRDEILNIATNQMF